MATPASGAGTPGGSGVQWIASTTASSAIAPQSSTAKTRVPAGIGPSSTVPTASVPGVKGKGGRRWYLPATTSRVAKETPAASTRIRTAPARRGGGGMSCTSSSSQSRQDSHTRALMRAASLQRRR
jgi:hypothetical protein